MSQPQPIPIDDVTMLDQPSSDHASRDHAARNAADAASPFHDTQTAVFDGRHADGESNITEFTTRDCLIEWLAGFLPGGPRADQASL
jgi:hypothetical protein